MPTDAQTAAPSAAASEAVLSVPSDAKGYSEWRLKGTLPTKPAEAAPANEDSEPTKKDETAASKSATSKESKTAPDTESGKHQEPRKGKAPADERTERLRKENADLQAELDRRAELRRKLAESPDDQKAEASTAKAKTEPERRDSKPQAPTKPKWDDFKEKENGYELYEAAKDEYFEKLTDYKSDLKLYEFREQQRQEKAQADFQETIKQAKERYPDYEKTVQPAAKLIMNDPEIHSGIKARINNSKVWADLIYVMGSDTAELQDFLDLAKSDTQAAYDKLVLTEHFVKEELASSGKVSRKAKATAETGDGEGDRQEPARDGKGKFVKSEDEPDDVVPEKKASAAPEPPLETGGRGSTPPDEVASAAKSNDFRAFRDAQNRRDLAKRKGA
jgi:hypothetical protein